jgi:hypothetical protein
MTAIGDTEIKQAVATQIQAAAEILMERPIMRFSDDRGEWLIMSPLTGKRLTVSQPTHAEAMGWIRRYMVAMREATQTPADVREAVARALAVPEVWSEEERDGMADAFIMAHSKHGHYESIFAVASWILRHRADADMARDAQAGETGDVR